MNSEENYLSFVIKQFHTYKDLAEKAMAQVSDDNLFKQVNEQSNSIAIIVQHTAGNMKSRWTNFLISDGEKEWRKRDGEFEIVVMNKEALLSLWQGGWNCLFNTLNTLKISQLQQTVFIRGEAHTVLEAINRQIAHYSYHVGQIVFIAKMHSTDFGSLSIPKKINIQ